MQYEKSLYFSSLLNQKELLRAFNLTDKYAELFPKYLVEPIYLLFTLYLFDG